LAQLSEFTSIHPVAAAAVAVHLLGDVELELACDWLMQLLDGAELPGAYACGARGLLFHARVLLNRICPVGDPALIPEEPAAQAEGDDRDPWFVAPLYGPAVDGDHRVSSGSPDGEDELEAEQLAMLGNRYPRGTWVRDRHGCDAGAVTGHRIGTTKRGLRAEQLQLDGNRWVIAMGVEIDPNGGEFEEFEAPAHGCAAMAMESRTAGVSSRLQQRVAQRRAAARAVDPEPPVPSMPDWMNWLL